MLPDGAAPARQAKSTQRGRRATRARPRHVSTVVPRGYNWNFVIHGGNGDLDFGNGDWAEGVSLLGMWCLPGSDRISLSPPQSGSARLVAGRASLTVDTEREFPVSHPLLTALRSSGSIRVITTSSNYLLVARGEGRRQLAQFFGYCASQ
jgi:hypothetical protein